ncbi:MAG: hypothetical protein LBR26_09545 [Prevotella sp.]|jgi:hypothetical protein|nr:hypothetical protein [Prevotella sp.]
MRKRKTRGKPNKTVLASIGRLYDKLREQCRDHIPAHYMSLFDDIFHDTILFVIHNNASVNKTTDALLIKHFNYRFRMIAFQTIKDIQQLKENRYADNKQDKETTEE